MHCPFPTSVRTSFPTSVRTSVIPECFYRESTAHQHTPGFPLKTCGNDKLVLTEVGNGQCITYLPNIYVLSIIPLLTKRSSVLFMSSTTLCSLAVEKFILISRSISSIVCVPSQSSHTSFAVGLRT